MLEIFLWQNIYLLISHFKQNLSKPNNSQDKVRNAPRSLSSRGRANIRQLGLSHVRNLISSWQVFHRTRFLQSNILGKDSDKYRPIISFTVESLLLVGSQESYSTCYFLINLSSKIYAQNICSPVLQGTYFEERQGRLMDRMCNKYLILQHHPGGWATPKSSKGFMRP